MLMKLSLLVMFDHWSEFGECCKPVIRGPDTKGAHDCCIVTGLCVKLITNMLMKLSLLVMFDHWSEFGECCKLVIRGPDTKGAHDCCIVTWLCQIRRRE